MNLVLTGDDKGAYFVRSMRIDTKTDTLTLNVGVERRKAERAFRCERSLTGAVRCLVPENHSLFANTWVIAAIIFKNGTMNMGGSWNQLAQPVNCYRELTGLALRLQADPEAPVG